MRAGQNFNIFIHSILLHYQYFNTPVRIPLSKFEFQLCPVSSSAVPRVRKATPRTQGRVLMAVVLSIVQDLISNGPGRAKTFELKVVKLAQKGKKVVVNDPFQSPAEAPISADDFSHIDEAIYRLTDTSGKSPEHTISVGRGHTAPSNDDRIERGYLTPHKQTRESFKKAAERINVRLPSQFHSDVSNSSPSTAKLAIKNFLHKFQNE